MILLSILFWFSVLMIFYAYFGYPLCLMAILAIRKLKNFFVTNNKPPSTDYNPPSISHEQSAMSSELPNVSFIITAYNEESRIEEKLKNSIDQDYPKDKLEILVASDCSSDRTDEIVQSYADRGIHLVRAPERKGKENAQKHAVDASQGDILVFSDVATILKPNAITTIVSNFRTPTIGCVSSEDKFIDKDGQISGEGAYVRYEMFLRSLESKFNTLVGLSGSFFAARREVCQNWQVDLQSDFNTLLNSIRIGLKGVSDPASIGYYHNISNEKKEFNRKVRTVLRGISVLMRNLSLLNPAKYGSFSWQLFSHKLCRWLVPIFMITAYVTNAFILGTSGLLVFIFIVQTLFYLAALYYSLQVLRRDDNRPFGSEKFFLHRQISKLSKLPYFFTTVNLSILVSWWKYIKGDRATFWEPSKR